MAYLLMLGFKKIGPPDQQPLIIHARVGPNEHDAAYCHITYWREAPTNPKTKAELEENLGKVNVQPDYPVVQCRYAGTDLYWRNPQRLVDYMVEQTVELPKDAV